MSRTIEQHQELARKIETAVEFMKTSESVPEWNHNRENVKKVFKGNQNDFLELWYAIDAQGLIVEVLGKDAIRTYHHNPNYGVSPAKEKEML